VFARPVRRQPGLLTEQLNLVPNKIEEGYKDLEEIITDYDL
jgi:hypothetical protein